VNPRFRSGFLAEDLGVLLLRGVALVAPVPRSSEDAHWDAVATLLRKESSYRVLPENAFYVQLKAASEREIIYNRQQVEWLNELQLPLFIGSVDVATASIVLYTCHGISFLLTQALPPALRCFLDRSTKAPIPGTLDVTLDPVLRWTLSDLADANFVTRSYDVLKPIIQLEQRNAQFRKMHYFEDSNGSIMVVGGGSHNRPALLQFLTPYLLTLGLDAAFDPTDADATFIRQLVAWVRSKGLEFDPANSIEKAFKSFKTLKHPQE
jgi:hypothetical protein